MSIHEVFPFFAVRDMQASLTFYVDGLGFAIEDRWVDEGVLRWCKLRKGSAGLMLQEYRTEGHDARTFSENKGEGVSLHFSCDDAVALYRAFLQQGVKPSEPQVANRMWTTKLKDPDGYELYFQSSTEVREDTKLSEVEGAL